MLSGPGWGNVNTIDAKWVAQMTKYDGMKCYMREMNVHVSLGVVGGDGGGGGGWVGGGGLRVLVGAPWGA
jgi:hypothetical protein